MQWIFSVLMLVLVHTHFTLVVAFKLCSGEKYLFVCYFLEIYNDSHSGSQFEALAVQVFPEQNSDDYLT